MKALNSYFNLCLIFQNIYELYHNGKQTTAEVVLSHDVGEFCVSNMAGWCGSILAASKSLVAPTIMLAISQEEKCAIVKLKPKLVNSKSNQDTLMKDQTRG